MIRIILVDDHAVVRRGLRSFLESDADFNVVGEAPNGRAAIPLIETLQPDLVITDVVMPEMDGLTLTQYIVQHWPAIRVILISMQADIGTVQQALSYGAAAYLTKGFDSADLTRAIQDVIAGRPYLDLLYTRPAAPVSANGGPQSVWKEENVLTPREQDVLERAAQGFSNEQIADQLSISPHTAETHRARVMHKLGLNSQTELVRYALRKGILYLE